MGRNTALHTAPQAINAAGSSIAKIFANGPAYAQKGQQLALMQALQNQQIASGASTQRLNDNKAAASEAIDAYIESIGGDEKIYQRDAAGNVMMSNDNKPMIRQDVGARMIRAGLKADPNWNPAVVLGMMGAGKPLDPVHIPADGGKTLHSSNDNRFEGAAKAATAGVTPAMVNNADPSLPAPDLSANPDPGVIPEAGATPASSVANAATAGLNTDTSYQNPAAKKSIPSAVEKGIASNETIIGNTKKAIEAANANPGAFGASNVFGRWRQYLPFAKPEDIDTSSAVGAVTVPFQHTYQGGQVTDKEDARAAGLIPSMSDKDSTNVVKKLSKIQDFATQDRDNLVRAAGVDYTPPYPGSTPIPLTAPAASPTPSPRPSPPQAAIQRLRENPHELPLFEQTFGAGSAKQYLGQ